MTRAVLLLVLLLTGCRIAWSHPDHVPEVQFKRDRYECQRDAASLPKTQQSVTRGVGGSLIYADPTLGWGDVAVQQRMFRDCMEAKGYVRE